MSKAAKPRRKTSAKRDRTRPTLSSAGLRRLARAVAAAPAGALSHDECTGLLEYYADSEQRGENAASLYPAIAQHLQACERCRVILSLLQEPAEHTLRETGPVYGADALPPLSFLPDSARATAWQVHVRSSVAGGPLGLCFVVPSAYLRQTLAPVLAAAARGEVVGSEGILLLSDTVPLGAREVTVDLRATPSQDAGQLQFDISIVASTPLPEPVRVILDWNDASSSTFIHNRKCSFAAIPALALEAKGDLKIDLEAGASTT